MLLIKNVQIHDAINPNPYKGDILVENGKIAQIAADIAAPEGAEVVDATGLRAYPVLSMLTAISVLTVTALALKVWTTTKWATLCAHSCAVSMA